MRLSEKGKELIRAFESCETKNRPSAGLFEAYFCPAGVLTIGWGHTNDNGRKFKQGEHWSQEECDHEFGEDMKVFDEAVTKLVGDTALEQHQFDALVSFAYNAGVGALRGSTLLRKVKGGDMNGAALEFAKWVHGGGKVLPGLVRRRASEALMFIGVEDANFDGKPDGTAIARSVTLAPR